MMTQLITAKVLEWQRLSKERDQAENLGEGPKVLASFEGSMARIEEELMRVGVKPDEYDT